MHAEHAVPLALAAHLFDSFYPVPHTPAASPILGWRAALLFAAAAAPSCCRCYPRFVERITSL